MKFTRWCTRTVGRARKVIKDDGQRGDYFWENGERCYRSMSGSITPAAPAVFEMDVAENEARRRSIRDVEPVNASPALVTAAALFIPDDYVVAQWYQDSDGDIVLRFRRAAGLPKPAPFDPLRAYPV